MVHIQEKLMCLKSGSESEDPDSDLSVPLLFPRSRSQSQECVVADDDVPGPCSNLPRELLLIIFRKLEDPSDIYNCAMHSRSLMKLDAMLISILDGFCDFEFYYIDRGIVVADTEDTETFPLSGRPSIRQEEKRWLPFPKDVGQSILESYSRVMESLAFNIMARIDDLLYVDDATKQRAAAESTSLYDQGRFSCAVPKQKRISPSPFSIDHPCIGSILGCRAEILQLDVNEIKMDCFLDE
ncbi:hypothetical protein Q3G72_029730 [Acer saccharum]|nr:hypothetical protein Q3G72_029730 [Acer saccharum]